jgi:hypothetical protein
MRILGGPGVGPPWRSVAALGCAYSVSHYAREPLRARARTPLLKLPTDSAIVHYRLGERKASCASSRGSWPSTEGDGGAGDGNRTRIASLEGWHSTIELLPQDSVGVKNAACRMWWGGKDSNLRRHSAS